MRGLVLASENGSSIEPPREARQEVVEKILVREIETAPGPPWDQWTAAKLQARLGAPLPIESLQYRLFRSKPWTPRGRGHFVIVYAKASDTREGLTTSLPIGGRTRRITFRSLADRTQLLRDALRIVGFYAAALAFLGLCLFAALARRDDMDERLQHLENQAKLAQSIIAERTRSARENALLAPVVGDAKRPSQVAADLAWLAKQHAPAVHLDAVHWRQGMLAVEARGEEPPLAVTSRPMQHSVLTKGVTLWGLWPEAPAPRRLR